MINHELTLLGTLVINENSFNEYRHLLDVKLFKNDLNAKTFSEIKRLKESGVEINPSTFRESPIQLSELYMISLDYSPEYLISELRRIYVSNEITNIFSKSNSELSKDDSNPEPILAELINQIGGLMTGSNEVMLTLSQNVDKLIEYVNSPIMLGIRTGIDNLDQLGGLLKSDLVILAGRTSQGKTSFALSISKNMARERTVGIISLEMTSLQLTSRLVASDRGISAKALITKRLSDHDKFELNNLSRLKELPIFLDDNPKTNLTYIISKIRSMTLQYNVEVVIVDYLQLITNFQKGQSKEQEVGNIARTLKNLAKELNICIVALSQLSRTKESAQEPKLSELRDSGQIEEAADTVLLIYRPEVYGILNFEDGESTQGRAEITVAKGRNIGTGQFRVSFNGEQTKFDN